ncbi:MAG: transcriptional repressor [Candidatus Gracilibacteria bacterium]|nr:transcriptional repressor [Candidatus Gracilibacteria bacterium]
MEIEQILRENNNRVTPERVAIYNYLKTKHIFSYNNISQNFGELGRASIFRTLNLFLDLGVIRKVEIGEKTMTYELNDHNNHHEHMKCENCKEVISFDSDNICNKIFQEAKKLGFKIKSHNIGVLGTCKNCV